MSQKNTFFCEFLSLHRQFRSTSEKKCILELSLHRPYFIFEIPTSIRFDLPGTIKLLSIVKPQTFTRFDFLDVNVVLFIKVISVAFFFCLLWVPRNRLRNRTYRTSSFALFVPVLYSYKSFRKKQLRVVLFLSTHECAT